MHEASEFSPRALTSHAVEREIAPGDSMFEGDEEHYFAVGAEALRLVRHALAAVDAPEPQAILDLPCGHGRVLRYLRAAWPTAEIAASDLDKEAVEYCSNTFDAVPYPAQLDPDRLPLRTGHYDLVWVGSLFTHLPLEMWRAYAQMFFRVLKKDGLLVFTTLGRFGAYRIRHGFDYRLAHEELSPLVSTFDRKGFAYASYPNHTHYGICLASPAWVVKEITSDPGWKLVHCAEMAWDQHQDVYACQKL
jgi:SAM-dependent methyltransferase